MNIAFNNISVLKADDFVYLPQLRSLNISHSQITHIELGALSSFTRLDMLDLSNNRLKRIDFGLFIPSLDLTPLYLEGNDIVFPNLMSLAITSKASHWPYARRFLEFLMKNCEVIHANPTTNMTKARGQQNLQVQQRKSTIRETVQIIHPNSTSKLNCRCR